MTRPRMILAFLSLAVLLAGCGREVSPEAWALLESGKDAFRTGDNESAIGRLDAFLQDNSGTRLAGEAYYFRGRARLAMGDIGGARADLTQAAGLLQDKLTAAQALLHLGVIVEDGGELPASERLYRQSLEKLELGQKPADEALYRLGGVLQKQGRWAEADPRFDRLIFLFPASEPAREAQRKVRCTAWTIRTAVLADRRAALAAAAELAGLGLGATVREVVEEGRLAFWVQVGRYGAYSGAAAALGDVRARAVHAVIVETR